MRCAAMACWFLVVPPLAARAAEPVEEALDVPYGTDELQRLDIYRPKGAAGKLPTVMWIHGGGWREGDKRASPNGVSTLATALVDKGYVAVSCNYRLMPKHRYPAHFDDVQRAVRWLKANAAKYNIDPERIGVVGISAGGHLACMLAVRDTRASAGDELDRYSSRVKTAISLNGVTDLRESSDPQDKIIQSLVLQLANDDPAKSSEVVAGYSPLLLVDKQTSPTLFIVGTADPLVTNRHSTEMADALKKAVVATEVLALEGEGHGIFPSITPKARDAILDWFAKRL